MCLREHHDAGIHSMQSALCTQRYGLTASLVFFFLRFCCCGPLPVSAAGARAESMAARADSAASLVGPGRSAATHLRRALLSASEHSLQMGEAAALKLRQLAHTSSTSPHTASAAASADVSQSAVLSQAIQ